MANFVHGARPVASSRNCTVGIDIRRNRVYPRYLEFQAIAREWTEGRAEERIRLERNYSEWRPLFPRHNACRYAIRFHCVRAKLHRARNDTGSSLPVTTLRGANSSRIERTGLVENDRSNQSRPCANVVIFNAGHSWALFHYYIGRGGIGSTRCQYVQRTGSRLRTERTVVPR